jgi:hypothetical protein
MSTLYFLVVSMWFDGTPLRSEGTAEFPALNQCQYAAALFVQQAASPGYRIQVECIAKKVNSS